MPTSLPFSVATQRFTIATTTSLVILTLIGSALLGPASATAPSSTTSLSYAPPYSGLIPQTGVAHIASSCHARAGFNLTPAARPTTGRIVTSLFDASNACPQGPAYSAQGANLGFSGPMFSPSADCTCNVSFEWRLTWTATLRAEPANGSAAFADSSGQMYLVDFVFDVTTQTDVGFADSFFWNVLESNGTMHVAVVNATEWANTTVGLLASDTYELQSNLYVYFNNYSTQGSSAFGYFDLGTKGTGGQLAAMSVVG